MNRKIIPALAFMSVFCGLSLAASAPAAARLTPTARLDAAASAAAPEKVATIGPQVAIGCNWQAPQGIEPQMVAYIGDRGTSHGIPLPVGPYGRGGTLRTALADEPSAAGADVLFDN